MKSQFWNVLLESDVEDQWDWLCQKGEVVHRVKEEKNVVHAIKWTTFCNMLLKQR
jgi:hypothetical protein